MFIIADVFDPQLTAWGQLARNVNVLGDTIGRIIEGETRGSTPAVAKLLELHSQRDHKKMKAVLRDLGYSENESQQVIDSLV